MSARFAIALIAALQLLAISIGVMSIVECSESDPLSMDESACEAITSSILNWLAAVLWPSVLFAGLQFIALGRRYSLVIAVLIVTLSLTFWAYVLLTA